MSDLIEAFVSGFVDGIAETLKPLPLWLLLFVLVGALGLLLVLTGGIT